MFKPMPKAFVALFVAVMLLCGAVVTATLFHQAAMMEQISQVEANLEAVRQRLRKQQVEYAQVQEQLPLILAEADVLQPQAEAAYEQEQALRQQRKELRSANAALADELTALQEQTAQADEESARTAQALAHLMEALDALSALSELYE